MNKIIGDNNTINMAKNAKPGDKSVYINFDAINELPEEFEVVITKVTYDKNQFCDIGNGNFMPNPELMYKIAEACGISGGENSISSPIVEDVDINPMLCKSITDPPTYRKMIVGRSVKKYSERLQEDGTLLRSSPCTSEFNVWERCCELWSKEEMYSEGYTKQSKYPPKYNTQFKRKAHFDSEMKFAHAKAETKAHLKTIRELAGLTTGYNKEDIDRGYFIFSKVRRSREILKAESAARLSALSQGVESHDLLFDTPPAEPEIKQIAPEVIEKTKRETFIDALTYYITNEIITPDFADIASKVLSWLLNNENAEEQKKLWKASVERLKMIEEKIPEQGRIKHEIY